MFDVISLIIFILIIISKVLGKSDNKKTDSPKGSNLWDEFEKTIKKINNPQSFGGEEQKKAALPKVEKVKENEVNIEKSKAEELTNKNVTIRNIDDNKTEVYTIDRNISETKKVALNEEIIYEQDEYEYDLSINREDIIKSIIFSELLNEPLCKRNAK
jgi:hypothetical protein